MITAAFDGVLAVGGSWLRCGITCNTAKSAVCACGRGGVCVLLQQMTGDGNFRRDGRIVHRRHGGGALGRRGRGGGIRGGELVFLRVCAGFDQLCRAAFPVVVPVAIGLFGVCAARSSSDSEKPAAIGTGVVAAGPPPAELEGQSLHRHG